MTPAIKELKTEAARDVFAAQRRSDAVDALAGAIELLQSFGFSPELHRSETGVLSFEVDLQSLNPVVTGIDVGDVAICVAQMKIGGELQMIEPKTDDAPADEPVTALADPEPVDPEPEPIEPEAVDPEPKCEAAEEAPADPGPEPEAIAEEPAELITGPISDDERDLALDMFADGAQPSEVASALGRAIKQMANLKFRSKDKIEALQNTRTAPSREPDPEPELHTDLDFVLGPSSTAAEREINTHLNALGYFKGWTPARDLLLAEGLAGGNGPLAVSEDLNVSKPDVVGRWMNLNTDVGSLDHQARLLRVLRIRAGQGRDQVAAE
ncbi:MAG: hypothetical protein AAF408_00825 [Pseudomonadota bacterium]